MHEILLDLAILAYVAATGLAFAYLVHRHELTQRLTSAATGAGWALHTAALVALGHEAGRPPFGNLPEAVSVAVWAMVLLEMWVERRTGVKVLPAFLLPVVVALSLKVAATHPSLAPIVPALSGAWLWVHIGLVLIGIAAFALNFAGALMFLLQVRQLKARRPGVFYYRLPDLETLDRLSYRTLAVGFPFLTTGLVLGVLWAGAAWGSIFSFDPITLLSVIAWVIYAGTLAGRAAGWHGRRAAYLAVIGFAALMLTLGVGALLPGKHG